MLIHCVLPNTMQCVRLMELVMLDKSSLLKSMSCNLHFTSSLIQFFSVTFNVHNHSFEILVAIRFRSIALRQIAVSRQRFLEHQVLFTPQFVTQKRFPHSDFCVIKW